VTQEISPSRLPTLAASGTRWTWWSPRYQIPFQRVLDSPPFANPQSSTLARPIVPHRFGSDDETAETRRTGS
jgi:hypothetical protein